MTRGERAGCLLFAPAALVVGVCGIVAVGGPLGAFVAFVMALVAGVASSLPPDGAP